MDPRNKTFAFDRRDILLIVSGAGIAIFGSVVVIVIILVIVKLSLSALTSAALWL